MKDAQDEEDKKKREEEEAKNKEGAKIFIIKDV